MIASMPVVMVQVHDFIHDWEMPIIIASGLILMAGWGLALYSRKVDCHDKGCCHGACAPKKSKANLILIIATALFAFNVTVYLLAHRSNIIQHGVEKHLHHGEEVNGHDHSHPAHEGQ